jgi:hypothetical protein
VLNRKRINGKSVTINKRTSPGYGQEEQKLIAEFRSKFSEQFLGKFSLKSSHLKSFFQTHPGKVPVSILIYSAEPRRSVSIKFQEPDGSSKNSPSPISPADSRVAWRESWSSESPSSDSKKTLSIHRPGSEEPIEEVGVEGGEAELFKLFPNLPEGTLELRIRLDSNGMKPVQDSAFVHWKKASPSLSFSGKWVGTESPAKAWSFDPRRDRDILNTPVKWSWKSDQGEIESPTRLIRRLALFDRERVADGIYEFESVTELPPSKQSAPLSLLFTSDEDSAEPLPLRGLYRLRLEARWKDGSTAKADAWFELPEPRLVILGQNPGEGLEESPRKVKMGDVIKIGNWMHDWKGFDYELSVEERKDEDWKMLPSSTAPLKLVRSGNEIGISVTEPPSEDTRFTVTFGPELSQDRELVELTVVDGYVQAASNPILPWILGTLIVLTGALFTWNFFRQR